MWGSALSDQLGESRGSNLLAFVPLHATSPEDLRMAEPSSAAPLHFVPSSEEAPDAIMDKIIDGRIGRPAGTWPNYGDQLDSSRFSLPHLRPSTIVAGPEQVADLGLNPPNALLGGAAPGYQRPTLQSRACNRKGQRRRPLRLNWHRRKTGRI